VYSGDCGRAADLEALIAPGDVLLSEVSFGPGPVAADAMHLDGPAVGELAARTRVGRVLLTHLQMGFDPEETVASVRARYDGPVELVEPGASFTI
jgi:ribonuclease BN (tRNA processing enzyme)